MFSAADLLKLSGSLCINSLPLTAGPRPYRMALERSLPEPLQSAPEERHCQIHSLSL